MGDLLEEIRSGHRLPGIAAAIVDDGEVTAQGVAGVRQVGTDERIALEDRFMIGSCTKRMTAAMIGRVIDAGRLTFETPLAEIFPEIDMRDDYRTVTIAQLLTFTGGLQPYTRFGPQGPPMLSKLKGSVAERRTQFVAHVLQEEPAARPGTERVYSNASYAALALAASRRTGRTWEALMQDEIFQPLGLKHAGFGRPRTKERPDQPWQHLRREDGYEPEPENRPGGKFLEGILVGAGGVHCSIRDLARFAGYELAAELGKDSLLKPETAKHWQELSRGGRREGRPVRGGSQSITATYVLWPSRNRAAAVAINGGSAFDACQDFFKAVEEG
jgi:CubicO group peptidase (beta-lactamase class C family)